MRAVDPDLDKRESFLLAAPPREAAEGLPEGRRALLVGQPANAAAVPGAADQVIPCDRGPLVLAPCLNTADGDGSAARLKHGESLAS
jgi:hypothetical protein